MIKLSFIKTPKPQRFEVKPRYYDPVKERQGKKRSEIRTELGVANEDEDTGARRDRMDFRRSGGAGYKGADFYARESRKSLIRMLIYLTATVIVSYLVLRYMGVLHLFLG